MKMSKQANTVHPFDAVINVLTEEPLFALTFCIYTEINEQNEQNEQSEMKSNNLKRDAHVERLFKRNHVRRRLCISKM